MILSPTPRSDKIRAARLKQPKAELERKADKARSRSNIWAQEELDAASVEAEEMVKWFEDADPEGRKLLAELENTK